LYVRIVFGDTEISSLNIKSSFLATFLSISSFNTLNQFDKELADVTLVLYACTLHSYTDLPFKLNVFHAETQLLSVISADLTHAFNLFHTSTQSNTADFSVLLYNCTKYQVAFFTLA
jgi:hypothetical protein